MFKNLFLSLIFLISFFIGQITFAKDIGVKIYAPQKITTSNINLKEGDAVNFAISEDVLLNNEVVIKKDEKIKAVITEMHDNNFICEPATIFLENFETKNVSGEKIKLRGNLYISGKNHWMFTQFLPFIPELIRGGEVQIRPLDTFTIYMDEKL